MPLLKLWAGSLVMLAAVSLPLQAASPVKVGSKIDTEGALLGNIILQVLESHGVPTVNKVQLGTTPVVRGAITSGELDIYPEYTGNGAFFFKDENDAAWKNAQQGYEKVKKLDSEHNKLIWLTPAPANNTWTIAVRQDVAEKNKLTSLADLSRYLQEGGTFKLAASAEFIERADALPAFEKAYGFKLGQDQLLSLAGGDTAVTIKAAAQQTSGVNAAMAYGTDGPVAALGLQTLSDPQGVQPIYAPAPVVRGIGVEGVSANGTVATASLRQPRCKNIAATECQHCSGRTGCQKSGCRLPETKRVGEVISRDLSTY